jgi:hypothetical protein
MLKLAQRLLSNYSDVMLPAERGFANHKLINWLQNSNWHYCLRLPCDVMIHGARNHPIASDIFGQRYQKQFSTIMLACG